MSMTVLWIIIIVIMAVIEALTLGLTTIWFAGGGIVAAIFAALGAPIIVQVILFLVVSIALLYFTRPIAVKKFNKTRTLTLPKQARDLLNALKANDRCYGKYNFIYVNIYNRKEITKNGKKKYINDFFRPMNLGIKRKNYDDKSTIKRLGFQAINSEFSLILASDQIMLYYLFSAFKFLSPTYSHLT